MAKLPRPPAALPPLRANDTRTLDEGLLIWRVYGAAGGHPAAWNEFRYHGPVPTGRFDHHEPPRHDDPEIPDRIEARDLDRGARAELKTLSKENADWVARHLVAASEYLAVASLQADALVTDDDGLASAASGIVRVAPYKDLLR